jgi:hypothetical protein
MSLRKKMDVDTLDLSLKHTLKNWTNRKHPPEDGKSRLLKSALRVSRPKESKLSVLISMTLHENFVGIYLDSFKNSPYYSLQPGAIGLNYTNGLIAK